jgi:hypothetical protein
VRIECAEQPGLVEPHTGMNPFQRIVGNEKRWPPSHYHAPKSARRVGSHRNSASDSESAVPWCLLDCPCSKIRNLPTPVPRVGRRKLLPSRIAVSWLTIGRLLLAIEPLCLLRKHGPIPSHLLIRNLYAAQRGGLLGDPPMAYQPPTETGLPGWPCEIRTGESVSTLSD